MGFAFDGDADRMLAVDSRGRVVDGDHVLFLWGSVLQDRQELPDQRLVATVMSNLGFERAWERRGGVLERGTQIQYTNCAVRRRRDANGEAMPMRHRRALTAVGPTVL